MQDNQQIKPQKQFMKLKNFKYKRIGNPMGNLATLYKQTDSMNTTQIIEFPMIEKPLQKQSKDPTVLIIEKRYLQQQLIKKILNEKSLKNTLKQIQANKKKQSDHCMNMLGLDIIKIQSFTQQIKRQNIREQKFKKIERISQKMSEIILQKQFSQQISNSQRKRADTIQINEFNKIKMSDSYVIKKRGNSISTLSHKKRVMSTNQSPENRKRVESISSPQRKQSKKQYLYKKLQGTENKKKQQFGQVYERRIKSYMDFLFKIQLSHNFYINLDIKTQDLSSRPKKLKAYVGPGNNGAMIKGLLKRRFWWTVVQERNQDCHFVWTQIKINQIFHKQIKTQSKKSKYLEQETLQNRSESPTLTKNRKLPDLQDKQIKFFENNQLHNNKLLHDQDLKVYQKAYTKISERQRPLSYEQKLTYINKQLKPEIAQTPYLIHNHLPNNFYLGNKKALFHNLKQYYELTNQNPFDYLPFTFHIKNGFKDPEYVRFCQYHKKRSKIIKKQQKQQEEGYQNKKKTRNIWIVKPGQNSNQGRGIIVIDQVYQLNNIMKQTLNSNNNKTKKPIEKGHKKNNSKNQEDEQDNKDKKTFIVQMYIDRPFLYNNRKFDIRHYMLITNFFGVTRAYWYQEGYIRTSSYEFNIHNFEPQIHLTNDAVQKKFPQYGKYQSYNKISYEQFQRYLDLNGNKKYNFKNQILPKMKKMATDAAKSVFTKISPQNQMNNFQIFGLDFMIDKNFKPWLIQINTNPCLDCACPLLDRIIPYMVEQSFKLSLDLAYPPPHHYPSTYRHFAPLINLQTFKYELIFDSQIHGNQLFNLYKKVKGNLIQQIGQIQEDQTFKDEGKQIKLDDFT